MEITQKKATRNLSDYQIAKMQQIIEDRWDEVWQVVTERARHSKKTSFPDHNSYL